MKRAPRLPLCDWSEPPPPPATVPAFAGGIPPHVWHLIEERFPEAAGSAEALRRLLAPKIADLGHPFDMPGVREASAIILSTISAGGEIVVFGDFDADGVTGTAILSDTLAALGAKVRPFIPLRAEGYGLGDDAVTRCLAGGTPALLVTVDCGLGAVESLGRFLAVGAKVIVTDHHEPGPPLPPDCLVIAPHLPETPPASRHICGAGVAFKLACGLVLAAHPQRDAEGVRARSRVFAWLDALAIATVADVVPLVGDNRTYTALGLARLNDRPRLGLKELILATFETGTVDSRNVGFILAPHLNSAGRMNSAEASLNLLLADDLDTARKCATDLKHTNALRKSETTKVETEAFAAIEAGGFDDGADAAVVVAGQNWAAGVIGLAAAKLCERYMRPAVVLSIREDGSARGSVRAPAGYDAYAALADCNDLLYGFGGHSGAAGLSLSAEMIPAFRRAFCEACLRQTGAVSVRPAVDLAGWLEFGSVDSAFLAALHRLEPFGAGNEEPVWGVRGVTVKATQVGKSERKSLRIAMRREDGFELQGVWFSAGEHERELNAGGRWDVAGTLMEDFRGGETGVKLRVVDARRSE